MGPAPHGLPQGSVLAPLLYIIYTSELGPLLTDCALLSQLYADDVQAYLHCLASDAMAAVQAMTFAPGGLGGWIVTNRLRLNPSKTQYIWLGTRQQLAKLDLAAMALRFPRIAFSLTVRDLRLTLDQQLTFAPHINRLCRDCYYKLRQLRVISRSLTSTATATLVHAFVTSRLDYCSTLYIGLPAVRLGCLERVVRTAV